MRAIAIFAGAVAAGIVIFGGLSVWSRLSKPVRVAWAAACAALLVFFAWRLLSLAIVSVHHPPLWDAMCFWIYGRVAVTSHAIYVPSAYHALAAHVPQTHDADFSSEVLDVGFPYYPFTIPLAALFGIFPSVSAGLALWYGLDVIAIAITAVVAWRRYFSNYGLGGFLACALSIVACGMVAMTVSIAQTVLLLLMFLVLYEGDANEVRRGIWLGLACTIKPFAVIFLLYPLVRARWRELSGAAASLGAAFVAAIAIVGWANVLEFFTSPPFARATSVMFSEITNQSLYAAFYRAGVHSPAYVAIALAIVLFAATICRVSQARSRDLCLAMLLSVALIVYPAALSFYAASLLFVLWIVWKHRAAFGRHADAAFVTFAALFYIFTSTRLAAVELIVPIGTLWVTAWMLVHSGIDLEPVKERVHQTARTKVAP